ncbi:MAG: WD40 repeat domain-containing protein [Planctomycetaceae bacterium]
MIQVLIGAADPSMPPEGEPRPIDEEIALLKSWIDAGATGPAGVELDRTQLIVPHIESRTDVRPVSAVDWSRDGKWVAVARYEEVTIHPVDSTGPSGLGTSVRTLTGFPGKVTAVHFTPDGSRLVTASGVAGQVGRAAIWNAGDGTLIREFTGHRDVLYDAELSPNAELLATASYDRQIILWNVATGEQVRTLTGHNGAVYDVTFSPDGTTLVSASADDTCKVWRVADGERLDTLGQPTKEQYVVTFSPDGKFIVAGGADNRIRVWEFISRQQPQINPLLIARFAHEGPIVQLAFTPDGSRLVSSAENRTVKLWDTSDYSEITLYEPQPAVAMALAVAGDGHSFLLGRMNGSLASLPISAASASSTQTVAAVAAVAVKTNGDLAAVAEQEPNNDPASAMTVTAPTKISGLIQRADANSPAPDADVFRFTARAGEEWVLDIDAARSGSKLDSFVEVLTADGQRIERVLLQALRDSYFTFRGKDADQADDFRIFNWQEMQVNDLLYANGEVVKFWLPPRGPDSGFMIYPGKGKRWGWFDTTPLAHPLGEPIYIVRPYPPGTEIIPNGLPVFTHYFENDDEARRELGADSRLFFTAPADGDYLVRVRDVRGLDGAEFKYTLAIRPQQPDFKVTLEGASPTIAAGSAKEFRLVAQRFDNFDGPIRVDITGLPPGFTTTTPLTIEPGQLSASGVILAAPDAPAPTPENASLGKVTATATIQGMDVTHDVAPLGEVKLAEKPKVLIRIESRPDGAQPVGTSPEGWPEYEISPGQTIMLQVRVERNGLNDEVRFGTVGSGRNLPFGTYVDNIGLSGLLVDANQDQREFFVTALPIAAESTRAFHLTTAVEGEQSSWPVILHVRQRTGLASRPE